MLSNEEKKALKTKTHALNPIVLMGDKGLTATVVEAIKEALFDHELIKVKLPRIDREDKKALIVEICDKTDSEVVQQIGFVVVLYKLSDKK